MSRVAWLVIPSEPIGVINPDLHGAFAEHLGELIYPGLWADGARGSHPEGLRQDVLQALQPLALPVLRWPGGNFADSYRWRDGIGPRAARPARINTQWGNALEPNHFGTHEFIDLCRALGCAPYLAGNLGSETPAYLKDWVEYCNLASGSQLSAERTRNGSPEPFQVRYWGVGNESWGAGGNMGPEHYAAEFARYRTYLHEYSGTKPFAVASGPNSADFAWTERFFEYAFRNHGQRTGLDAFALHHYVWNTSRTALDIDTDNWFATLTKAWALNGLIEGHRLLMDRFDPTRKVALVLDEWGAWHKTEPDKPSHSLFQQNTVRDALIAAIELDLFHRHAAVLRMANLAQVVNVLHALVLADESRCFRTPTYHVFDLYRPHRGARAVRCVNLSDVVSDGGSAAEDCRALRLDRQPQTLRRVLGSASLRGDRLTATLVNTHPEQPCELELEAFGAPLDSAECVELGFEHIRDCNTFEQPERVRLLEPQTLRALGGKLRLSLRPGAILRVQARLRS